MFSWIALGLLIVTVVLILTYGRRAVAQSDDERIEALRPFDGKTVVLGIGNRFITPQRGTLMIGESGRAVTLEGDYSRSIPLADIRWVSDPDTGTMLGGPW